MNLRTRLERARKLAADYLDSLRVPELGFGIHRESSWEGGRDFPGMLLPGTYNAAACRFLIGSWNDPAPADRAALAAFLSSHQLENGVFRVPGMTEETVYYPDMEYDDLHVTNYSLGVLDLLGEKPARPLAFAERYADPEFLDAWLERRDLGSPWTEGNYLVNVGSLLAWLAGNGHPSAPEAFLRLLEWHEENQDPGTGFWSLPGTDALSGMAGAAHDLHLFYLAGRPVPLHERIVDVCLGLLPGPAVTACLDVDAVDILANLHAYGYRTGDIEAYLEGKLRGILAVQNPDGGFPDAFEGYRTFDGWESYREPQGISNAFASWFRMAAAAMAACVLFPETRGSWRFRGTIGIGYFPEVPAGLGRSPVWLEGCPRSGMPRPTRIVRPPDPVSAPDPRGHSEGEAAAGPPPGSGTPAVSRRLADALIDRLRAASPETRSRAFGFCRFDLGGDGILDLAIDAEGVREAVPPEGTCPDLVFSVSAEDLDRILTGTLGASAAYMRKRLRIRGDISRALALQAVLKAR